LPTENYYGTDSLRYRVYDDEGLFDEAEIKLTVVAGNGPPTANDALVETDEDVPVTINILDFVTDPNGIDDIDRTSLEIVKFDVGLKISLHNGNAEFDWENATVTYTPNLDYNGEDSFMYKICDKAGECDSAVVYILIHPVNDAPKRNPNNPLEIIEIYDDKNISINILDYYIEVDNEPMSVSVITNSPTSSGEFTLASDGRFVYNPFKDSYKNRSDEISFRISDPHDAYIEDKVFIVIKPKDSDGDGIPDYTIKKTFAPASSIAENRRWIIKGLEYYESNEVSIVNRQGNLVYHRVNYSNEDAWDGKASVKVLGSQELPEATYYYKIKLVKKGGEEVIKQGSVYLKR